MDFYSDPSFINNNFSILEEKSSSGVTAQYINTTKSVRSVEKLKKSNAPLPQIKEEENITKISLIVEENTRLKDMIESLLKKITEIELEKKSLIESKMQVERTVISLKEELFLNQNSTKKSSFGLDEKRFQEIEMENTFMKASIEEWKSKIALLEKQVQVSPICPIEKIVEVPVEKIVYIDRPIEVFHEKNSYDTKRIEQLELELMTFKEENRNLKLSIEEWRSKTKFLESQSTKYVEKPIERIVEKTVFDDSLVKKLEQELYLLKEEKRSLMSSIEEWKSKVYYFENQSPRVVEKKVEVPVEVIKYVEKPVEIIKYVEKPVERIIEKKVDFVDESRIREFEQRILYLSNENSRLKAMLEEWRVRLISLEEDKLHSEKIKRSSHQEKSGLESEVVKLRRENEYLISRPPEVLEKVVEKVIEKPVPVEIFREKVIVDDKEVTKLKGQIILLEEEINKQMIINEELTKRVLILEAQPPTIVEKRVERPIEIVKEKLVVAGDKVLRELENDVVFLKAENRKLKSMVEEWKSKVADLELMGNTSKIIERKVEVQVPVLKEKFVIDESRTQELERRFMELNEENSILRKNLEDISQKLVVYEEERISYQGYKLNIDNYESEILLLKKEIQKLMSEKSVSNSKIMVERRTEPVKNLVVESHIETPSIVNKKYVEISSTLYDNDINMRTVLEGNETKELVKKSHYTDYKEQNLKKSDIIAQYENYDYNKGPSSYSNKYYSSDIGPKFQVDSTQEYYYKEPIIKETYQTSYTGTVADNNYEKLKKNYSNSREGNSYNDLYFNSNVEGNRDEVTKKSYYTSDKILGFEEESYGGSKKFGYSVNYR